MSDNNGSTRSGGDLAALATDVPQKHSASAAPNDRTESVRTAMEITVRGANDSRDIERVFAALAESGMAVLASRAYLDGNGSVILLVTEDATRAHELLGSEGFRCTIESVVLVDGPPRIGRAARLGVWLSAAGICIKYSYASHGESDTHCSVFKTTADSEAVRILRDYLQNSVLFQTLTPAPKIPEEAAAVQRNTKTETIRIEASTK
jgi:hypothetical protein